jgi:hypothetical protein
MDVTRPGERAARLDVPAVCGQAFLCRQDADCAAHQFCEADARFAFGSCRLLDH